MVIDERGVRRRVVLRIVPLLMLLYFVAYLDRVNIGFAALTMNADIGLGPAAFGLGASLFFVGYFLFEVPSNLVLARVGARRWIARILVTWGLLSAAMAFVRGPTSFQALRFLLGVAEAGFFPGVILYLSWWFPARERASIVALFMTAVPISTALGSPLSGLLLTLDGALGLRGWQWLFLVEAAPAILLGPVVWFALPDRPRDARWLQPAERDWLEHELAKDRPAGAPTAHGIAPALRALTDPRILLLGLVYFGTSAGLYTLGIWSPQIIASAGLGPLATGFVNAVPPAFAVVAMLLWARHSDRSGERGWHVLIACSVAAAGLLLAASATGIVAMVAALVVANVGISAAKPPLWSLPTQFLTGSTAAAGIAAINSIGNLGGVAGPALIGWLRESSGGFASGLAAVAGLLGLSAVLMLRSLHPAAAPTPTT